MGSLIGRGQELQDWGRTNHTSQRRLSVHA